MDIKTFKKALPYLFNANITPLIIGHHGVGKSQCISQYANENDYKLIDLRLGQMADAGELIGLADFQRNEKAEILATQFFKPHFLNFNENDRVIIFVDEINRGTKDILQAIFQLVYDKKITLNGFEMGPNMHVVAAMNPATDDYDVLDFQDDAFADRFCHIKFEPSVKDWLDYARLEGVDPSITGFIGEQRDLLDSNQKEFSLEIKPSRRSWINVNRLKTQKLPENIFRELAMGLVGTEACSSYFQYIQEFEKTIQANDVLNDYSKVKKKVVQFSSVEGNRHDLLRNVCDNVKVEMEKLKQLNKTQEKNVASFITTIPKDLAYGFLKELFDVDSFLNTESDNEYGLSGESKFAQQIIKHFDGWDKKIEE